MGKLFSRMPTFSILSVDDTSDANNVTVDVEIVNTDTDFPGSYVSGIVNAFSSLDDQLFALPSNQATYASAADIVASWSDVTVGSFGDPGGNVTLGWSGSFNPDGSLSLTVDTSGGIGIGYERWYDDSYNGGNQSILTFQFTLPKSQLEVENIAGWDPSGDATLIVGGSINDVFIGTANNAA